MKTQLAIRQVLPTVIRPSRRLRILQCLMEAPGYTLDEAALDAVLSTLGHSVSSDLLRTELAWLGEQGLLDLEILGRDLYVATLSRRGLDVGRGRTLQPKARRKAKRKAKRASAKADASAGRVPV